MQVATTILEQLGGGRFIAMTGCKHLVSDGDALQFSFQGCQKANRCRIELTPMDVYRMKFYKINRRTMECPEVKSYHDVYCDMLQELFTDFTGLYTHL